MMMNSKQLFKRGAWSALSVIISVVALLILSGALQTAAQTSPPRNGYTVFRDGLTVGGKLTTVGPVRIGGSGSIGIYNTSGDQVMAIDSAGNITTTGNITTADGFTTADLVRGFGQTARLVGSMAVPTTTVTGTAVVATGPFSGIMSGNCSLQMVPTTTVSYCALSVVGGNIMAVVYNTNMAVATEPAVISWFAWVEDES